jgi:hypothetical protein
MAYIYFSKVAGVGTRSFLPAIPRTSPFAYLFDLA